MKKTFVICISTLFLFSCKKDNAASQRDTILQGKTSILVDQTLLPIIEDQVMVFESVYNAKINLISQSEKESIIALFNKKADIVVLPRKLTTNEDKALKVKNIYPKTTVFAIDGIAFISNKNSNDTLITLQEVKDFMQGNNSKIKGLVFDNPNSSTMSYVMEKSGVSEIPKKGVFSFSTNQEVIKYVAENNGMIGVLGINWITQPKPDMQQYIDKINVMYVKNNKNKYIYPSQEYLADGVYPLARDLYIINCQGYEGLGMGFASFIAGEKGQRIIMQSGLAPKKMPSRKIVTRKSIEKEN